MSENQIGKKKPFVITPGLEPWCEKFKVTLEIAAGDPVLIMGDPGEG